MPRSIVIGPIQFMGAGDTLAYRPARTTRLYQAVAAVGIGFVLGAFAITLGINEPLKDLGDSWNSVATWSFGLLAVLLLLATPIHLQSAAKPYILDGQRRTLQRGHKEHLDLRQATEVRLLERPPGGGEYGGGRTWSVVAWNGQTRSFPLLTFEHESDAQRAAEEVAEHLSLPVGPG